MIPLEVAFTTCPREPHYVVSTLASYFNADRRVHSWPAPRVVVDGTETDFLGAWAQDDQVVVELPTAEQAARVASAQHVAHRICLSTYRALAGGEGPLLLCQDDLRFARNWVGRFVETVQALERSSERQKQCSVLTLWVAGQTYGARFYKYDARLFHGNCCLYFTADCRQKVTQYFAQHALDHYELPDDLLVRRFAATGHGAIFASNPSLVQHVGGVSSHAKGLPLIQARSFRESV